MVFAFAYGSVSSGHMNPAVTVGALAAGAMRADDAAGYIVAQLIGGAVGALLLALYIVAPLIGAILAAVMHKWLAWLANERVSAGSRAE